MYGTLLVIDDSSTMRKIVIRTLKMAGVEFELVVEAADGEAAIQHLREKDFNLIMCDINMPLMSGLQLLQRIKAEKLAMGIPIIMVTTEGSEPQIKQALLDGARGYIKKPFGVQNIEHNVKPLLTG